MWKNILATVLILGAFLGFMVGGMYRQSAAGYRSDASFDRGRAEMFLRWAENYSASARNWTLGSSAGLAAGVGMLAGPALRKRKSPPGDAA